ncbi:hypothetical protein ACOME3_005389 [Neoechinorhynchus agilis]
MTERPPLSVNLLSEEFQNTIRQMTLELEYLQEDFNSLLASFSQYNGQRINCSLLIHEINRIVTQMNMIHHRIIKNKRDILENIVVLPNKLSDEEPNDEIVALTNGRFSVVNTAVYEYLTRLPKDVDTFIVPKDVERSTSERKTKVQKDEGLLGDAISDTLKALRQRKQTSFKIKTLSQKQSQGANKKLSEQFSDFTKRWH